jgi:hypothetical protein
LVSSAGPAWFQRVVSYEIATAGLTGKVFAYIDDIALAADTPEEHNELLAKVLDMLLSCGLRAHSEKSVFGAARSSMEEQCIYMGSDRGFESHRGYQFRAWGLTPVSENMRWWARRNRSEQNALPKNVPGDAYMYPYRKEHGRDYMSKAGPSVKQPPKRW